MAYIEALVGARSYNKPETQKWRFRLGFITATELNFKLKEFKFNKHYDLRLAGTSILSSDSGRDAPLACFLRLGPRAAASPGPRGGGGGPGGFNGCRRLGLRGVQVGHPGHDQDCLPVARAGRERERDF